MLRLSRRCVGQLATCWAQKWGKSVARNSHLFKLCLLKPIAFVRQVNVEQNSFLCRLVLARFAFMESLSFLVNSSAAFLNANFGLSSSSVCKIPMFSLRCFYSAEAISRSLPNLLFVRLAFARRIGLRFLLNVKFSGSATVTRLVACRFE